MPRLVPCLLAAACAFAPPSPVVAPAEIPDVVPPAPLSLTVMVPADCPHMIVDVDSTDASSLVIACFDGSNRTFFANQHGPPLGTAESAHRQLVISYAGPDAGPSAR